MGIHPLLSGELLLPLDQMGHGDAVVIADAHFPAARMAKRVAAIPGASAAEVLAAVATVLPLDDDPALDLMTTPDGVLPVQLDLAAAAGLPIARARLLDRAAFYEAAAGAFVIIRTGETRAYGNAILRKGLVV